MKNLYLVPQLPLILILLISCNGKQSDSEIHSVEKNKNGIVSSESQKPEKPSREENLTLISNQISKEEQDSVKETLAEIDIQKANKLVSQIKTEAKKLDTYQNQIPFFENALLQHKENKIIRIKIGCELAERYLLKYLIEGDKSYYSKSYNTFIKALEEDTGLVYISEHFKVNKDTLIDFKEELDNEKSNKGQEALLINSLLYDLKSDVRKQN